MIVAKLTAKQQRFCDEYLIDLNATQAAIRAGYSPRTAEQAASRLLTIVKVSDEIAREMAERSKRTGINQDRVVKELAKLAFVNIADVVDLENATVRISATDEDLACIQSVKIKPSEFGTEREIKLYDKKASLELLGRHLGMFKDKLEVEADMDLNITVDYGDEDGK
jgi:phage terminase small subunit